MDFRSRLTAEIPYLRRFARGLAGDAALADDLVQDCLERALAKEHLYDPARAPAVPSRGTTLSVPSTSSTAIRT